MRDFFFFKRRRRSVGKLEQYPRSTALRVDQADDEHALLDVLLLLLLILAVTVVLFIFSGGTRATGVSGGKSTST